ncbi:hypothetical protein B0H15DRAFT_863801 [Mycena belliarum]|uniref:Uncharacterized protein n=1 Tax=Mycena belliarum TaxID=1033014 RepID=A0AAD6XK27_9AGAR|nr:hypothetical protein B0H15DRAFT_863801 [Mycena belliae]
MSFLPLSSTAGPSDRILHDLSEYCASETDSPAFSSCGSTYSFVSLTTPTMASPKAAPEIPDIIVQADRFQERAVKEKMLKALRVSTGSGFTRPAPASRDRASSLASIQGLPPSASDSFFGSPFETSTPLPIGLGIFVPSGLNKLQALCPLASPHSSPMHAIDLPTDGESPSLLWSPSPTASPPAPIPAARYTGLGRGLPTHTPVRSAKRKSSARTASSSSLRFASTRAICAAQLLPADVLLSRVPSLPRAAANGILTRLRATLARRSSARQAARSQIARRLARLMPGKRAIGRVGTEFGNRSGLERHTRSSSVVRYTSGPCH